MFLNHNTNYLSAPFVQESASDSQLQTSSGSTVGNGDGQGRGGSEGSDVGGPRFKRPHLGEEETKKEEVGVRYAGEASVYDHGLVCRTFSLISPP